MRLAKKEVESEIFTGSMADISFLLIIYFMLTSVFAASKGLDFRLPKEDRASVSVEMEEAIDIKITPDGPYRVDGKDMTIPEMEDYIQQKLSQNKKKPVIVRGDKRAPYYRFVDVLDMIRDLQENRKVKVENLSFVTWREIDTTWGALGIEID